ncbi:hypothetical protein WICPIJ_001996 [Wickerhamomyces pijperi]|uniref:Uncharacterized protein n=1 Tax=Wickerhamomyces pijperi TaxID=599730 RepID=A0A9P8QCQ1_WICPI|nr:hypothetical protein WICPIJ_001996 [Wickerhamomyces pijperi]
MVRSDFPIYCAGSTSTGYCIIDMVVREKRRVEDPVLKEVCLNEASKSSSSWSVENLLIALLICFNNILSSPSSSSSDSLTVASLVLILEMAALELLDFKLNV